MSERVGYDYTICPCSGLRRGTNPQLKDWSCTEFTLLTISHTLGVNERKEKPVISITLALLLLLRLIVPFVLLITIGEWVRRREIKYWFKI